MLYLKLIFFYYLFNIKNLNMTLNYILVNYYRFKDKNNISNKLNESEDRFFIYKANYSQYQMITECYIL